MITEDNLKQTPLHQDHLDLNARMVPFGGWQMPVQYEGILAEYEQTRKKAALFDISHMGEFILDGDVVDSGFDQIVTIKLVDLPIGSCRYGAMLNDQGGTIDDLIVFRLEQKKWFIVVNAATTQKDFDHITSHLTDQGNLEDVSMKTGKLDIQGPLSREIMKKYVPDIEKLNYYMFEFFDLLGENVLISRTGYTGELGYEIYYPWDKTSILFQELLNNDDCKPAGLGARDVLRLEVGYSLYGHELSEDIAVLESGLNRFIDFDKEFIGKKALLDLQKKGIKRKIVGLKSDNRRSPREGQKIFNEEGAEIGIVSSGTFSPALNAGIGLGFVDVRHAQKSQPITIGEKNGLKGQIHSKIFFHNGTLKH